MATAQALFNVHFGFIGRSLASAGGVSTLPKQWVNAGQNLSNRQSSVFVCDVYEAGSRKTVSYLILSHRAYAKNNQFLQYTFDERVKFGKTSSRDHLGEAGGARYSGRQLIKASSAGMIEPVAEGGGGGIPPRGPGRTTGGGGGGGGDSGGSAGGEVDADLPEEGGGAGGLWARYCYLVDKYPILTKGITAACLNIIADLFCQLVVERSSSVDLTRLLGFSAIGLFLVGPALHIWYGLLPRLISVPGEMGTVVRLLIDQVIFSPMSLVSFFAVVLALEGRPSQIIPKLKKDLMPTVFAQWKVWIPFQYFNFKFVPPTLQVATASLLGLVWTVYMSLITHSKDASDESHSDASSSRSTASQSQPSLASS